jgi:hypothetical protein
LAKKHEEEIKYHEEEIRKHMVRFYFLIFTLFKTLINSNSPQNLKKDAIKRNREVVEKNKK